jgi:hypothetical protein
MSPDALLCDLAAEGLDLAPVAATVQARAEAAAGEARPIRPLLRRAGLPRLGKTLGGSAA